MPYYSSHRVVQSVEGDIESDHIVPGLISNHGLRTIEYHSTSRRRVSMRLDASKCCEPSDVLKHADSPYIGRRMGGSDDSAIAHPALAHLRPWDFELMLLKQITWEHDQRRSLSERMDRASTPFERYGSNRGRLLSGRTSPAWEIHQLISPQSCLFVARSEKANHAIHFSS